MLKECEIVYTDYELRDFQEWKQACKLVAIRMLVMKKIINPAILEITEKYNEKMRERTDRRRRAGDLRGRRPPGCQGGCCR